MHPCNRDATEDVTILNVSDGDCSQRGGAGRRRTADYSRRWRKAAFQVSARVALRLTIVAARVRPCTSGSPSSASLSVFSPRLSSVACKNSRTSRSSDGLGTSRCTCRLLCRCVSPRENGSHENPESPSSTSRVWVAGVSNEAACRFGMCGLEPAHNHFLELLDHRQLYLAPPPRRPGRRALRGRAKPSTLPDHGHGVEKKHARKSKMSCGLTPPPL